MTSNFNQTLSGSANDASQLANGLSFSSTIAYTILQAAALDFIRTWGGFRFTSVSIPKNSHIIAADIQLYSSGFPHAAADDPNFSIYAEAADNSVDFSTNPDIVARSLTTANVAWSATNIGTGYFTSPDITAVIQEMVNRAGWASGNALTIICVSASGGSNEFDVWTYDQGNGLYAILDVTYEGLYAGPARTPKVIRQAVQRSAVR